jgi:hypothetical protein
MRVTRTIIDDVAGPGPEDVDAAAAPPIARSTGTLIVNSGFEEWDATAGAFPGWTAEQCQVAQDGAHATEGGACARLQASAAPASFYQTVQATAGQTYELSLDATAWGAARIEVFDESTGRPFGGGETVTADGTPRRYRVRFLVSGNGGETVTLRTPNVVLLEAGSIVTLDNVSLAEVQAES